LNRREFLTWSVSGSLALAWPASAAETARTLSPWITLHPNGVVVLVTTALEMGQGSRTGQARILADELDVPWDSVQVTLAPEQEPYLVEGALYSGGSETIRSRFDLLRRAGATVRHQLLEAAASTWRVEVASCEASLGVVRHPASSRTLTYGELAERAAAIQPPAEPALKRPDQWRYIGRPAPTLDLDDKVNGRARYGLDFRLPQMKFAAIRQCPFFGGVLQGVADAPALAVPGVRRVITLRDAVAVIADTTHAAFRGAEALDPTWTVVHPVPSTEEIDQRLAAASDRADARVAPREGGRQARDRLRESFSRAAWRHEATYVLPYLAHATLEPMNATARPTPQGVEIWAPCQSPTWARDDVAMMTGLQKQAIVIHPLLMGGGFGRRLKGDYAGRAAQVALAYRGPLQVVWSREEDFTHDHYRPAMRMVLRAALQRDGGIGGYEVLAATADDTTGGSQPKPYQIADYAATLAKVDVGVPVGSWRSVDPGMSLFAKESFIDECAHLAGRDPLEYRDQLLGNNARARRVLQAAATAAGWREPRRTGTGLGVALLEEWNTIVAHVVDVEVRDRVVRVRRVVAAMDCGIAINPQQVRAQLEGGTLMGLSAALAERITISDGRVLERGFADYPLLRFADAPRVDTVLLSTEGVGVGGVGEPPVPGVAPALANAIFAATRERLRRLPLLGAAMILPAKPSTSQVSG
jgi:isoquinoline 1-oxidoreductase beta subunit